MGFSLWPCWIPASDIIQPLPDTGRSIGFLRPSECDSSLCGLHENGLITNAQIFVLLWNSGRVTHICVSNISHHWFRLWLVACTATSHYLNQCWHVADWTRWNKFRCDFNQICTISKQEMNTCKVLRLGLNVLIVQYIPGMGCRSNKSMRMQNFPNI